MPRGKSLSRGDFVRVARTRLQREHGSLFSLSYGHLDSAETGVKISCVVSKKVSPRAVDRNQIKRRCRSVCAEALDKHLKSGVYIFYAKKGARGAAFADMRKEITTLLHRAMMRKQG